MRSFPSGASCEDEARINPPVARLQPFLQLQLAMVAKRLDADIRKHERPATLGRLELLKHELFSNALELLANPHLPCLEIHVLPTKPGGLAKSEAACQRYREKSAEAMIRRGLQERSRLFNVQRRNRSSFRLRHR